jgi:hypothetical protein
VQEKLMRALSILAGACGLLALSAGCGGHAAPTERMSTAEAAIRGAQELGAPQLPRAALHLKLAQEQSEKARKLIEDGYNERAELSLRRAQADAELAIAITKEHQTTVRAKQAQTRLEQAKASARTGRQ